MHFIIYSGFDRDADISVVKQIQKILDNKKATYSLASYRESGFVGMSYNKFSDVVSDADVVIVVGGDGTVLRAAEGITEAGLETPIFAVNRGQCGFLADTEPEDFDKEIDKVFSGGYELEKRTALEVAYGGKTYYALNEVIVYKKDITRPVEIEVFIGRDTILGAAKADGVCLATPTGSTAYSMSAGGSILSPDVHAVSLCMICAHTLMNKPLVLSDEHTFSIRLAKNSLDGLLMVDGDVKQEVSGDTAVIVKKADLTVNFIKARHHDFYERLVSKLAHWATPADDLHNDVE